MTRFGWHRLKLIAQAQRHILSYILKKFTPTIVFILTCKLSTLACCHVSNSLTPHACWPHFFQGTAMRRCAGATIQPVNQWPYDFYAIHWLLAIRCASLLRPSSSSSSWKYCTAAHRSERRLQRRRPHRNLPQATESEAPLQTPSSPLLAALTQPTRARKKSIHGACSTNHRRFQHEKASSTASQLPRRRGPRPRAAVRRCSCAFGVAAGCSSPWMDVAKNMASRSKNLRCLQQNHRCRREWSQLRREWT